MTHAPLGLSTSWNASGVDDGRQIASEISRLGFKGIEVEYRVSAKAVEGIEQAVKAGEIRVLSVHNYSPLAVGEEASSRGGDKRNLASLDETETAEALSLTKRSVDLARRLGAMVVIVHAGETGMGRAYFQELAEIVGSEGADSEPAKKLCAALKKERDQTKGPHLETLLRNLKDLTVYAAGLGIAIGIENRYYFHQIPLPDEVEWLLEELDSSYVRYWHDVGHAHVMEALGFIPHLDALDRLKGHLIGMHLHDSVFIRDHRAPGTGEIDFPEILRRATPSTIRIIELAPSVSEDEIRGSLAYLERLGLATCQGTR